MSNNSSNYCYIVICTVLCAVLMHLSMRCPTTPTSGVQWEKIGLLSRGLVPRGGDRWGICHASDAQRSQVLAKVGCQDGDIYGAEWGFGSVKMPRMWGEGLIGCDKSPPCPHIAQGGGWGIALIGA